jgi:hypothetical protein
MSQYTQTGIDNAKAMNLTPADVRLLNYQAVASLCGIALGQPGDTSPADFFYTQERAVIAVALEPPPVLPDGPPSGGGQ